MSLTSKNIPQNWKLCPLGDIATFSQGIQVGTEQHISELLDGYQRFIRIIDYTQSNNKDIRYVPNQGKRYYAKAEDIVMIRYGTPGLIGRGLEGIIANNMFKISFNNQVLNDFAEHYFKFSETIKKINDGSASSTMPAINFGFLKKLPFVVPPIQEQQKIAEILSTIEDKIEVIDRQITETQVLKKGLMQRLLTKGIGHTEFKDSSLGMIPKSWDMVRSNDVFELIHGYQFRDYDFTESGLPIVKIGQINKNGEIDMNGCSFFSSERAEEFADKRIYNGDVLMALTGATLGKSCWVDGLENPVYQNYRVGKFVPHDENVLSKQFLYFLVGSPLALDQILSKVNSGAQGNVGKSDFEKLKITLPPLKEQHKISSILSSVDEKLNVLIEKKAHYQELKQGLMQQLLTGKIRVNI